MKNKRHSYQIYKDTRDCLTRKLINKAMYVILNHNKKPLIHKDGYLLVFYKMRWAADYIVENGADEDWKIKKVQLDITTL